CLSSDTQLAVHGLVGYHEGLDLIGAPVNGVGVVLRPLCGVRACKVGVKLAPRALSSTGGLQGSSAQLLEHINTGLNGLEADKGSKGALDGVLDLRSCAVALIPHVVEVFSGVVGVIAQAVELIRCGLDGPQEFPLDCGDRMSKGG